MQRRSLFQFLPAALLTVDLAKRAGAQPQQPPAGPDAILGDWHMLDSAANEVELPRHRMDLRFSRASGELRGAILNRNDGSEIPMAKSSFDGATLRFQLKATGQTAQADMPTMTMTARNGRLEGQWIDGSGKPVGPPFKLIRARK